MAATLEQSPHQVLEAFVAGANADEPRAIGLLYRHSDFKEGADAMLKYLFPGIEVVDSSAVSAIAEAVRERSLLFILTEGGLDQMTGRYLVNQLDYDRADGKLEKQNPPIIWAKRDPGPTGAHTDPSADRFAENNAVDVLMKTPFTVGDLRIAIAEAIMRNSGQLKEVERLAAEKTLKQFSIMVSTLVAAWRDFLEKPVEINHELTSALSSDPAVSTLISQLEILEKCVEELGDLDTAKDPITYGELLVEPLRKLRGAMGLALSHLSIVGDQALNGCLEMPKEYAEALKNIKSQAEMALQLMQMMRGAYHDDHKVTWYRILKTLESQTTFESLTDASERMGALQNLLQYVESEAQKWKEEIREVAGAMKAPEENKEDLVAVQGAWEEMAKAMEGLASTASQIAGMAAFPKGPDVGHYLINKILPFQSMAQCLEAYAQYADESGRARLLEIATKVSKLTKMINTLAKEMKSGELKGLRERAIAMISEAESL